MDLFGKDTTIDKMQATRNNRQEETGLFLKESGAEDAKWNNN
jgi:hypothetical protein